MSEPIPPNPGQPEGLANVETLGRVQDAIRGFVEARIGESPLGEDIANDEAERFGLPRGEYDYYQDTESRFGGGFKKFVSKEDPSDILVGLTFANVGGPATNPNRSLHNYLLRPNGDIIGRITTENAAGIEHTAICKLANDSDPDRARVYERFLDTMHTEAQSLLSPPQEVSRLRAAHESRAPIPRRSWLGRLIGRFLLRR